MMNDTKKELKGIKPNDIIHIRQDSASELEALFQNVMNPDYRSNIVPMRKRNLPPSFFNPPDRPRRTIHGHSQSMSVLVNPQKGVVGQNHSRSSSSDSSNDSLQALSNSNSSNINNNNAILPSHQSQQSVAPVHRAHISPAQRRLQHVQHPQNFQPNCQNQQQSSHNRSKSSPAQLQLTDITVKPSEIPANMPLPPGWSVSKTPDGQQYFLNHNDKTTTWEDPRIIVIKQRRILAQLQQQQQQQQQQQVVGNNNNLHPQQPQSMHVAPNSIQTDISGNPIGLGWEQSGPQQNQGNVYFLNNQQATSDNGQWVDSQVIGLQQVQQQQQVQQHNPQLRQMMKINEQGITTYPPPPPPMMRSVVQHPNHQQYHQQTSNFSNNYVLYDQQPGEIDPFLGGGGTVANNGGYHQAMDPNLNSAGAGTSSYVMQQPADDYMAVEEEMDTGMNANVRRFHLASSHLGGLPGNQQQHPIVTSATAPVHFDLLETLPSSNIDYPAAPNQQQAAPSMIGATGAEDQLLPGDFEDVLSHVKTEGQSYF